MKVESATVVGSRLLNQQGGRRFYLLYPTRMATAGPLAESISAETSGSHSDYWSHMERVSTFKKAEHHHKLTPAQQELMQCDLAPFYAAW